MKLANWATIQKRNKRALRKGIYTTNILLALFPVVNGFFYLGAGGRVAHVVQHSWLARLRYLLFALVLFFLPFIAIAVNMALVEELYLDEDIGDLAMWAAYVLPAVVIGVLHSRTVLALGPAFINGEI